MLIWKEENENQSKLVVCTKPYPLSLLYAFRMNTKQVFELVESNSDLLDNFWDNDSDVLFIFPYTNDNNVSHKNK